MTVSAFTASSTMPMAAMTASPPATPKTRIAIPASGKSVYEGHSRSRSGRMRLTFDEHSQAGLRFPPMAGARCSAAAESSARLVAGRFLDGRDREATFDVGERSPDRREHRLALGVVDEEIRIAAFAEPLEVEIAERSQRLADRKRIVRDARRLRRDPEFEIGGPVAVTADEEPADDAVIQHAGRVRVRRDVLGQAARAPGHAHPAIVAGTPDAQQALMERQARPRTAGERVEARSAARERRDEARAEQRGHSRFRSWFGIAATRVSEATGSVWAFTAAVAVIVAWLVTGPIFGFSDTWQLVINTGTTIVTFLMVFLIQNTQNRDAKAIHLKLDELLRGVEGVRTDIVDLEDCTDGELARYDAEFESLGRAAREDLLRGLLDTDSPDVPVEERRASNS